jgi:hypothetical protein
VWSDENNKGQKDKSPISKGKKARVSPKRKLSRITNSVEDAIYYLLVQQIHSSTGFDISTSRCG